MSVLACERRNCSSIMCDRYSYRYGNICEECFEDLIIMGPHTNIETFMDSAPQRVDSESRRFFQSIFQEN